MPSLTLDIKFGSELHGRIINQVRDRVKASQRQFQGRHNKWKKAEEAALAYLPEKDIDAVRRVNREQAGVPEYTTIQIPYSYAVLMASHTYWTTVFMSRDPVMQFAGRHGETEQQTQALEALMGYQVQVGEMLVPWYIWLMDVGKYGMGVTGLYWDEQSSIISGIEEKEEMFLGLIPSGKKKKIRRSRRVKGYHGNKIFNVRPYDFFPDPRVTFANFQQGEFAANYNELGWNVLLQREALGYYTNLDRIRKNVRTSSGSSREDGSSQLELPNMDAQLFTEGADKKMGQVVSIYECYIDLVPEAWKLGKSTMPEKWVFTVTDDFNVVLGAQPLGANHNKFPYNVMELEPEGYAISNRGIPEILEPIQNTMDWLINSHFYNIRKTLNDQFVVDPSRVVMADVLDPLPGGIIRLKPAAYGTDPRVAMSQLQVTDVTRAHLSDLQTMFDIGSRTSGVNEQILGALGGSGRKTATEVRTSSTFGINRLKTQSEYASAMGWSPMSQMMVSNSQQYYDGEQKFRIVGDLIQEAGEKFVNVTQEDIAGFYDFVPIDGTLPVDRFAQANLWRDLLGQLRNVPEVAQQYDIGRIFAWVAQLAGLKNINQFKIQVQPDGVLQQQAQAGNVVPLGGGSNPEAIPQPSQVGGNGGLA